MKTKLMALGALLVMVVSFSSCIVVEHPHHYHHHYRGYYRPY